MVVNIDSILVDTEDGRREARLFAHTSETDDESVKNANHAREVVRELTGDGITDGVPPTKPLFRISLGIVSTHKRISSYTADYQRLDGCPNALAEGMMEIYASLKRVLRSSRNQLRRDRGME